MTSKRGEVYREGNRGAHYFKLYLRAYLRSGVDPPRGQGHMAGKGISTQVMTSSHTYDIISTLDQYKRGNNPGTFHILNWSPSKQEECHAGPQVKELLFIFNIKRHVKEGVILKRVILKVTEIFLISY